MADYKKMYFRLFNVITDSINLLQNAQAEGENSFIESDDAPVTILHNENDKNINLRDISFGETHIIQTCLARADT